MALYHILPFTGLSRRKRGLIYGNIAHILESGIPVLRGMELLEEQAHNRRFRYIFKSMKDHIREGGDLGSAMHSLPEYFPEEESRMIASTENTGTAPQTFQRLSDYLIWYSDLMRQVIVKSIYPMFLLVAAFAAVPIIIAAFTGASVSYIYFSFTSIVIYVLSFVILFKLITSSTTGRHFYHYVLISIPWIGSVVRQISRARFARTYECMVAAGVPYFFGLRQAAESCGNIVIERKLQKVIPMVEDGMNLSVALRETNEFTPISLGMLEVGEESGKMEESLRRFSHEEEQKATNNIQAIGTLLPVVIYLIAAFVIVVFVILPGFQNYFDLLNSI